jgi:hypothetical protein
MWLREIYFQETLRSVCANIRYSCLTLCCSPYRMGEVANDNAVKGF